MPAISRRDFLKLAATLSAGAALLGPGRAVASAGAGAGPNIIILLFDAMSARHLSVYGYARKTTPHFERFAGRAKVYHSHYSGGNFTTTGTSTMLTGRYPWSQRALNQGGLVDRSLASQNLFNLIGDGYLRLGFAQNPWADLLLRQFQRGLDLHLPSTKFSYQNNQLLISQALPGDPVVSYYALDDFLLSMDHSFDAVPASPSLGYLELFLSRNSARAAVPTAELPYGRPFNGRYYYENRPVFDGIDRLVGESIRGGAPLLAYFHLFSPHAPYNPRAEFVDSLAEIKVVRKPHHVLAGHVTEREARKARTRYDEYIAEVDAEFGRLLDSFEAMGLLENSYVLVTADHGELFERGEKGHATPLLYDSVIHIPLLISAPGQRTREDIYAPTSNADLLPTLLSLAGQPIPDGLDGSKLPGLGGAEIDTRSIFSVEAKQNSAFGPLKHATISMIQGKRKLIYYIGYPGYTEVFELYDLEADLDEKRDLFASDPTTGGRMKDELLAALESANRRFAR